MIVLGIHGNLGKAEHDASAVLVVDGEIVAAAEEERFVRYKHAVGLMPDHAIAYCLREAGIDIADVDTVAFPRATWADFGPRLEAYFWYTFGFAPPVVYVDHHLAHAASAYLPSGFDNALVVTADQSGDGVSCGIFRGTGASLSRVATVPFPNSIGLFAAFMTQYLGFRSNHDEYKVMGLAAYGSPTVDLSHIFTLRDDIPWLDRAVLHPSVLQRHPIFHTDQLPMFRSDSVGGLPRRRLPSEPIQQIHKDLAASAQAAVERAVSALVRAHRRETDTRLCLAGGVAENSVAAGAIASGSDFDDVYVAPACGDAGTALGAALIVAADNGDRPDRVTSTMLGPGYSDAQVVEALNSCGLAFTEVSDPAEVAADRLARGMIVGWFSGRMEFGPRALGGRSLLADPSLGENAARMNQIKRREQFRPFGPSILAEHASSLFGHILECPFMSFTLPTVDRRQIVAATHVDGTSRPQTVAPSQLPYRRVIEGFYNRTGVPAVLNTSLNSGWEPIVTSPEQACGFLYSSDADCLVIGSFLVTKECQ